MKIFIDFDDVIFNTKQFKEDLKDLFSAQGISPEVFGRYYRDPADNRAVKTFNPWMHAALICGEIGCDAEKIGKAIDIFMGDISRYIFPDVPGFVDRAGKSNVCVVSFGNAEFQNKKIRNSQLEKYIKDVFVTEGAKCEVIAEVLRDEKIGKDKKIFFIDDRVEQIHEVKEKFPYIVTIFIKRPEGRYQEMEKEGCCNFQIRNLAEAEKIINRR